MSVSQTSVLLEKVLSYIDDKAKAENSDLIKRFTRLLYKNISAEDLAGRTDSDLYGAALSLWQKFSQYHRCEPDIRVFNPKITKDGWQSEHTIVEILVNDSPFLVDSVRMCCNRLGLTTHLLLHSPIAVKRNADNVLEDFIDPQQAPQKEAVFLIEIDRQSTTKALQQIEEELRSVLKEVHLVVSDWAPLQAKLEACKTVIAHSAYAYPDAVKEEAMTFLDWLADHNFTLMGYRYYAVQPEQGDFKWCPDDETSLGLMRNSTRKRDRRISNLPATARAVTLSVEPLILTKTTSLARVHRPAHIDYVGIKEHNAKGEVIGEHRFLGLYSASLYNSSVLAIPVLSRKINDVIQLSDVQKGSHANKAIINILETYPRDELLHSSSKELVRIVTGIFQMQERGITRMFTRKDEFGRFISCLVYVPRERYNTALRKATQQYLKEAFKSEQDVEFTTFFSESVYARTHYIVRVLDNTADYPIKQIEDNVVELSKNWDDRLANAIRSSFGEAKSVRLINRYTGHFSQAYMDEYLPSAALADINKLEQLSDENPLEMLFYRSQETAKASHEVRLKLYHKNAPIHLSAVLPMLEHFGLRVVDETPYKILGEAGEANWIMDFSMLHEALPSADMALSQRLFQTAFAQVWDKHLEDDAFNRLILAANLSGRDVTILRAYAKYMRQTGSLFSIDYIANTMSAYPHISALLITLFSCRFDPAQTYEQAQQDALESDILGALDGVSNLDDDRIIRRYLDMIKATVRTNFYQNTVAGEQKSYVSFKLLPELIPDMPLPLPKFEIFVYSPRVEGVHLRGGKVARGGLRWSDRQEDFRTEVLGLVKAQQVKNTVIVPVGAKGGFVCKQPPADNSRAAFIAEGQDCYRIFIRSLLDITDNIVDGNIVPPRDVVRHDEDDPYLVVAADKGTATFSDIANEIAQEFNFWLSDAFASGGSVGYDHKGMGITAKGAWESVKRHFREMGIDCQNTDFTAVGIGDMAGDVFGNGMLLSKHTKIIAAFNHMHIFFDPDPDPAKSYVERERLFADPSLNWADYNADLISAGGGVFPRNAKSVPLSKQMQAWLRTDKSQMPPNELIHHILQMQVDLIWNGGIGTYIKASSETHAEVGDRANDDVRVNGAQVKAKIVGEGGNLGATQLGRIEFARKGGRINTDFIDNAGGVDCSDNEVNIKILLNDLVKNGDLTLKQRNELLYDMTDDVADIVLDDCYRQTESISVSALNASKQLREQVRFIHGLEKAGDLNRELEFLPSDEEISDRLANKQGLTRPELSVLISYSKMVLKEELNTPAITDDPYYDSLLSNAFPLKLRDKYQAQMRHHPLRAEIIATKLTNQMINTMGFNYVYRMQEETGATVTDIAHAYSIVSGVYDMPQLWESIQGLDNHVDANVQLALHNEMRRSLRRAARWFIREATKFASIDAAIAFYRPVFCELRNNVKAYLDASEVSALETLTQHYNEAGVPYELAHAVSVLSNCFSTFDLAHVVEQTDVAIEVAARAYYQLGHQLQLHWFLEQINAISVNNHWQALARASCREELDHQQRILTAAFLNTQSDIGDVVACDTALQAWFNKHAPLVERWCSMMSEFKTSSNHEFAKFSVALRELLLFGNKVSH